MNPIIKLPATTLACAILALGACSDRPDASQAAKSINAKSAAARPVATTSSTPPPQVGSGTVVSATVAGAYSYIETDIDGQTHWIATAATHLQPGQKVAWNNYAMMSNFNSKAMNRNFDQIMFIDRISAPDPQTASNNSGTVLDAMTAAGYSYIQVDQNGTQVWLAAPEMLIQKGQNISWTGGSTMRNFSSRSLNRTFDSILFVSSVQKHKG